MKFYNLIILFAILLGSAFTSAANIPSVTEVESTIASGDYVAAKDQVKQVLKAYPDSYVANRYMLEIIKIENGRDNKPSAEYKIYENYLAKIEAERDKRVHEKLKAEIEAKRAESNKVLVRFILGFLGLIIAAGACFFLYTRINIVRQQKKEAEEFDQWLKNVNEDLLDINAAIVKAKVLTLSGYQKIQVDNLDKDNTDELRRVTSRSVNRDDVTRHIINAKSFLRDCGVEV